MANKEIDDLIVEKAKNLMYEQTMKNGAPAWKTTELGIEKGKELSKKYNVNEKLVLISLYLQHTIFSPIWQDDVQKNHPKLSAEFSKEYLIKWKIPEEEQKIILNAIEAHHNKIPTESMVAEIVKNAECFKFVTVQGALIYLHELGLRGIKFDEAVEKVLLKMEQKRKLLTLEDCIKEAEENCKHIEELFKKYN